MSPILCYTPNLTEEKRTTSITYNLYIWYFCIVVFTGTYQSLCQTPTVGYTSVYLKLQQTSYANKRITGGTNDVFSKSSTQLITTTDEDYEYL